MRRSLSVQRALGLLVGAAIVAAASVVCAVIALAHMNNAIWKLEDVGVPVREVKELHESLGGSLTSIVVLSALATVLVAVSAAVVRRPSSRPRLVACLGAIIALFLAFVTLSASPEELISANGPAPVRVAYANLLPSWYSYFTSMSVAVEAIVLIAAIVFMYRTDAGEYYRSVAEGGSESLGEHLLRQRRETDPSTS